MIDINNLTSQEVRNLAAVYCPQYFDEFFTPQSANIDYIKSILEDVTL